MYDRLILLSLLFEASSIRKNPALHSRYRRCAHIAHRSRCKLLSRLFSYPAIGLSDYRWDEAAATLLLLTLTSSSHSTHASPTHTTARARCSTGSRSSCSRYYHPVGLGASNPSYLTAGTSRGLLLSRPCQARCCRTRPLPSQPQPHHPPLTPLTRRRGTNHTPLGVLAANAWLKRRSVAPPRNELASKALTHQARLDPSHQ